MRSERGLETGSPDYWAALYRRFYIILLIFCFLPYVHVWVYEAAGGSMAAQPFRCYIIFSRIFSISRTHSYRSTLVSLVVFRETALASRSPHEAETTEAG